MKKEKVGVIVTYNRRELLLKNLTSLQKQSATLDRIIIIDNHSNDETFEFISSKVDMHCIDYVYLPDNIGGAGGFYTGIKKAYEDGADWIYVMDDDGRPYNNATLEVLFSKVGELKLDPAGKYIVNSLVICDEQTLTFRNKGYKYRDDLIPLIKNGVIKDKTQLFNGSLFSRGLVEEIGFPNKDFFIKGDEVDYRRRAVEANAELYTVADSLYYHPEAKESELTFLWKKYHISIESPWKEYYSVRNATFSLRQHRKNISALKYYIKRYISAKKIGGKDLQETLIMMKKGYSDGKKGKLGATIRP